jgi:hypothetical protein
MRRSDDFAEAQCVQDLEKLKLHRSRRCEQKDLFTIRF